MLGFVAAWILQTLGSFWPFGKKARAFDKLCYQSLNHINPGTLLKYHVYPSGTVMCMPDLQLTTRDQRLYLLQSQQTIDSPLTVHNAKIT